MTRNTRILLTALAIAVLAIGVLVYQSVRDRGGPPPVASVETGQVIRENSHRLNSVPDSDVTFVEFLDFECEGCRAVYPSIEQLRSDYGDRVNFVIRYFPLGAHYNAERAARAVEAAAQQGKLEAMYKKMYDAGSVGREAGTGGRGIPGLRRRTRPRRGGIRQGLQRPCHRRPSPTRCGRRPRPGRAGNADVLSQRRAHPATQL
jgi:thiol-disulfide isomerase/thioredoxin